MAASLFSPIGTVNLSATDASSRVTLTVGGNALMINNVGPNRAFYRLGSSTVAATTDSWTPIEAYATHTGIATGIATHFAAICATGETATIYITAGVQS